LHWLTGGDILARRSIKTPGRDIVYRLSTLLSALLLGGCASYAIDTADYQERLIRSLPNQREVSFSDTATYPGKILCGRYTTLSAQGFTMVTRDFIVGPDRVNSNPAPDEVAVYCSNDPEQALSARLGIKASDGDYAAVIKLRDDMQAIDRAINNYYNAAATLPRVLETLLEGDYGVDATMLTDPWGRTYRYEAGLSGRSAPQYQLGSYGADGAPGGTGADADVSKEQALMLDHVIRLAGY
jgi:hypothetical protein